MNDINIYQTEIYRTEISDLLEVMTMIKKLAEVKAAPAINCEANIFFWNLGYFTSKSINAITTDVEKQDELLKDFSVQLTHKLGKDLTYAKMKDIVNVGRRVDRYELGDISNYLTFEYVIEWATANTYAARKFYARMAAYHDWDVLTLRKNIGESLFEKSAISKKSEDAIVQEMYGLHPEWDLTFDRLLKSVYVRDFLKRG